MLRLSVWLTACLTTLLLGIACRSGLAQDPTFSLSAGQYWCSVWASGPWLPVAGDADGDGFADLLSLWQDGDGVINIQRTSSLGKPCAGTTARRNFGAEAIAAVCGHFTGQVGVDLVGVFADGAIRMASGMARRSTAYTDAATVGNIASNLMPKEPVRAVTGDFDGDHSLDILLVGSDGKLLLLRSDRDPDKKQVRFVVVPVEGTIPAKTKEIAAGVVTADGRARLFWIGPDHTLYRAALQTTAGGATLSKAFSVLPVDPAAKLAVGRFQGQETADVLVGRDLLAGGDPRHRITLPNMPSYAEMKGDRNWIVADFDGNGKDDLLRRRDTAERIVGQDVIIHYSSAAVDERKGFISTAQDGLLDDWKTGKVKPGGLDLAAMGCQVGKHDVIVEIGSFDNLDQKWIHSELDRAVQYYASLPIRNPDGSTGVALHILYQLPIWVPRHDEFFQDFDARYPPPEHLGITHFFWAEKGGPLLAQILGKNGHYNGEYVHFLHEFGHNLGLVHEGYWDGPTFCPIYPSCMNYTYNGSLYAVDNVWYSDGRLRGFPLEEGHLSERLPFPMKDVEFLSKSPYFFRLKPGATPNETLVDWNWNGVFGEENVAADINYKPGAHVGALTIVGRTQTAPCLASLPVGNDERLLLLYGICTDPKRTGAGRTLSPSNAGRLCLRWWLGGDTETERDYWSDPVTVEEAGVTGEASAVAFGGACWIAYPTVDGIKLRSVTFADGKAVAGPATTLSRSTNAYPTLVVFQDRLALLLWRDMLTPVGLRYLMVVGQFCKAEDEIELPCFSGAAVGAAAGRSQNGQPCLWVSGVESKDIRHESWLTCYRLIEPKPNVFTAEARQWAGGSEGIRYAQHRNLLLWEPMNGMDPLGRLYALAGAKGESSQHFLAMQIADTTIDVDWTLGGGWLTRQLHGAMIRSRSAPGACYFHGDIALAERLQENDPDRDDQLLVMFHGRGIESGKMGDFDDIGFIDRVGLKHSVPYVTR